MIQVLESTGKVNICNHIAFVTDGEIRVFKSSDSVREITLYAIDPGETCFLNASSILSDMKYPADVKRTDSLLWYGR